MAQQYKGTENNKTALAGSGNPQLTGEGKNADGAAQSVAGNLSNNFTLANVAAETKGEDKTVSNQISQPGDSADHKPLSTAGPGGLGPKKHQGLQSHEVDPALAQNPDKDNSQGHGRDVNPTD